LRNILIVTGLAGLLAAILVGIGEYILHYDAQGRFSAGGYDFMLGIGDNRSTVGHFFGVIGATLYPVGCYHIYLMLKPANRQWAFIAFLIGSFGFIVGAVWIGSRASVSALVQMPPSDMLDHLIALYQSRYETLLQITRLTTLLLSAIIIWLVISGRSCYPRWMAIFNPILLIIANFAVFMIAPAIGKHTMPIALNVSFFIFFLLSVLIAMRLPDTLTAATTSHPSVRNS